MKKIVLATGNKGKVAEFKDLLADAPYEILSQDLFNVDEVEETGLTFIENALIKARHTAKVTGLSAIADDSGLAVTALKGAPGIYSARYAGEPKDDGRNNAKLLEALKTFPDDQRQAYFYCALVFLEHADDPTPIIALGKWDGVILKEPKGQGGFGYDPLFYIPSLGCSAAELSRQEKSRYSHRGLALQKLVQQLG